MTSNERYQEYIIPELQNFWSEHREDYINSGLNDGLFLPYAFEGYDNCEKKIFYIGQDAPYWADSHCMRDLFDVGNYRQYLWMNKEVMRPLHKRLAWGNRTSFWTMIVKTHLYLMTHVWHNDIRKISEAEKKVLDTMGYGNVHFIPLVQTVKRYREENVNQPAYNIIDDALKDFNWLQIIVEKFKPDTIVVLSHAFDASRYYRGLDIHWIEIPSYVPSKLIQVADIKTTDKIIRLLWVNNPNYYKFCGTNMHDISDLIYLYA